jgi:putative heme-binding domain-containing protein
MPENPGTKGIERNPGNPVTAAASATSRKPRLIRWWALPLLACLILLLRTPAAATAAPAADATRSAINLEALSRLKGIDLEANPAVKAVVLKVLAEARGKPQFVELVHEFNIKGQDPMLLEIAAKDPSGPTAAEAMRLVLRSEDPAALKLALEGTNGVGLTEALGNTGEKEILPLLQPIVLDMTKPAALRKEAVRALAKIQEGAAALLEMARAQKLPGDLRLTASSDLNSVRWENIKTEAAQLLPLPRSQNAHPLPAISELIKLRGDPQNGAAVFRRETVGCIKCHQVNREGIDFGPNLSEIGTKLAKDAIYESILDPSAGIAFGYEAWDLELKSGDDALGLIVSETADELALKAVGGIVTRYKKADIARRTQQKLSIMPAGLEQTISSDELVDLVEYLASLKTATK